MYIATLCEGIYPSFLNFLQPNPEGKLFNALIKDNILLKKGQIWRFLTYSFLHMDFSHILFNSISLLIFGSMMEDLIKTTKMIVLWISTSILGILFSSLIQPNRSVGASVAIYGIIGAYV